MIVEALVGNKRVLSSGVVIFPKEEQVSLKVSTENDFQFVVAFEFLNKPDGKNIELKVEKEDKIKIVAHGPVSQLGSGPEQLMNIGSVNGKNLSMYYTAYKLYEGEFFKLEYAFYEG